MIIMMMLLMMVMIKIKMTVFIFKAVVITLAIEGNINDGAYNKIIDGSDSGSQYQR